MTGGVVWFTGLSGSGKSTIAGAAAQQLRRQGRVVEILDGDALRAGPHADLGFSEADRTEHLHRTAQMAAQAAQAGAIVLVPVIAPRQHHRTTARRLAAPAWFLEVHVATALDICEARDPKGLYARARRGILRDFTGIDAVYEPPTASDLVLDAGHLRVLEGVQRLIARLTSAGGC
jgi:adenylyl-sulfate kinase